MSKNPPTLADACIASALDKRMWGGPNPNNKQGRELLLQVASARKFVLDESMSGYLCDMSLNFWRGGLRKRIRLLENARQMARLPHQLTWIEFDYHAYIKRGETEHKLKTIPVGKSFPDEQPPARFGWLLRQHPKIETAFIASEICSSSIRPGRVFTHPVSICWCSDDSVLPWRSIKLWKDEPDAEFIVMMSGYRSKQVAWTFTYTETMSAGMMNAMAKRSSMGLKPSIEVRNLWALLATVNDLPIVLDKIEPSKGYVARGSYKKFLNHTVLRLTVPETRWRKLVGKTAAILRRRAHQVRGHWRKDWRQPLTPACEHDFNEHMVCRRCRGHQIWIAEHQRGDASIGFVTHDYEVHHD